MKFNKALLSLAVAGALATPLAVNAAAKIVVNDSRVGLPADDVNGVTYPTTANSVPVARGIQTNGGSYIPSDDVTVDQVYVRDDGNATISQRDITFAGPMPASARPSVSIAYATDVQLPDEGTLRFQLDGTAGGFDPSTANSIKLLAQNVDTIGYTYFDANNVQTANAIGKIAYGAATAAPTVGSNAGAPAPAALFDDAANTTTILGVGAFVTANADTGSFVEVGQSFDYADEDNDGDVDYVTVQLDTVSVANGTRFALDGYRTSRSAIAGGATAVEFVYVGPGTDGVAQTADDVWRLAYTDGANEVLNADGDSFTASTQDVSLSFNSGEALPRRTQLYLALPSGTEYEPVEFVVTEGSAIGDEINVSIPEAKNTAGVDIAAAIAGQAPAVTIGSGLALTVDEATSQIDVEADAGSRLQFVAEGGAGLGDTDLEVSRADVVLENEADYGITLDAGDSFELVLKRLDEENSDAVESVTLGSVSLTQNADGSWTTGDQDFGSGLNLLTNQDFEINVDGETILYPNVDSAVDWMAELVVTDDGADAGEVTSGTYVVPVGENAEGKTHTWTINGLQAKIPYLYNINADDWSSVVKIVNESANEANVSAKVILGELGNKASAVLESGDYQTAVDATTGRLEGGYTFDIESLGHVPAEGHLTFDGKHIIESLGLDAATNYHIEIELLVEAAQNKVHVAAQNKNPNGRADSPVLYFINQTEEVSCKYSDTRDGSVSPNTFDDTLQTETCTSRTVDGRQWQ
ncbi:hypothetical protein FIU82_02090 [Pseudoalteromonas sp. THAF3]|uniref:hypothetical protein n=1 Tax=Pseudoalteromonas sp. THAF3 TaxID=2587843 RepID=UPI0012686B3B|nr:hypothetical protein [Pseudoalteromonas sp. THAF3]QFU03807.1 hypothetical protein FIU82_02090 [Pseudoalteromonas sp. THAF3]